MAGAFIDGPITPPNLRVEQIFRLREPLVPDSNLPAVIIGVNRQVVFDELIGSYDGVEVDLAVASLSLYSATLVELDPLTYVDQDTEETHQTSSFPNVVFRHPQFGDVTVPKKDVGAGVLGWTFSQANGEFTLDAALDFLYTILTGVGDLSAVIESVPATVDADAGLRDFTSLTSDFIGAGLAAGDILVLASGRFQVMQVVNETQLVVKDLEDSLVPLATELTDAAFTIEKTVTDGGVVHVSYVANRADMANRLISVERDTVDELFGPESLLDPLGFYVRMALRNTNTTVLALQVASDDSAGHDAAINVLSTSEVPYDLVPLTQDEAILNDYIAHVNLMSTVDKAKERRVITNFQLVLFTTKVNSGVTFEPFGIGGGDSTRSVAGTAVVKVTAGQNNLHVLGVVQGDMFEDTTPGFEGEARIIAVAPAGAAPDDNVTLTLATPNTSKLFGTQASRQIIPTAAQVVGAEFDAEAGAVGHTAVLDGVTFTAAAIPVGPVQFLAGAGGNASLFAKLVAYFGDRFTISHAGGAAVVEVREILGGYSLATLGPAVAATGAVTVESIGGGGAVITMVPTGLAVGIEDLDTFVLDDDVTPVTFTFRNDQTTGNGELLGVNNYAVQIGGPVMSAANIRDRIIEAVDSVTSMLLTASEAVSPNVLIQQDATGVLGGSVITSVTAPVTMSADVPGTGATNGSPLTSWRVTTKTLTVDEQATYVAQIARDLNNRRVMNVWPDIATERFEDLSAGTQLQQQGFGIFEGRTVLMADQPNYGSGVIEMAARSNLLASDPLTKRPLIGPYDLHRIDDYFTQTQLDRILSTGTMLMEQLQGAGGTVQAVRGVTTDSSDLKVVEENVGAAVDKFTRLVRLTTKPIFGPNVIDPDGNFDELFSTKVQSVITKMTRRESREARDIQIVRVYENPARKDSRIMEVVFTPLFGANDGLLQIFI